MKTEIQIRIDCLRAAISLHVPQGQRGVAQKAADVVESARAFCEFVNGKGNSARDLQEGEQ